MSTIKSKVIGPTTNTMIICMPFEIIDMLFISYEKYVILINPFKIAEL